MIKMLKRLFLKNNSSDKNQPLREFVYLDEVSLRSLLSSQTGEVTESTSNQTFSSRGNETTETVGVSVPQIAKAERMSHFQTSNSSTIQTSRKATVQSWFRELLSIPNLSLIEQLEDCPAAQNMEALKEINNTSICVNASEVTRGSLVEFRVRLAPDPVFHLGTMVSEFSGMAEDFPEMFDVDNGHATLKEMQPVNKILQRLLAGLIPIRAEAVDYVVVNIEGTDFIVHRDAISDMELDQKPLIIVGVTEHLAYWKDIRRVLFSDAEFTVLCRVSRNGIQDKWTPVKLADLFRDLVPDLVEQINSAGKLPINGKTKERITNNSIEARLVVALTDFKNSMLQELGALTTEEQDHQIELQAVDLASRAVTASGQRSAFEAIEKALSEFTGKTLDPDRSLELREQSRKVSGLPLVPSLHRESQVSISEPLNSADGAQPSLLDVEFVAIYW